jgi:hypothetical protein
MGANKMSLTTTIINILDNTSASLKDAARSHAMRSFARGMRHERREYTGTLDAVAGFFGENTYNLLDIERGYTEERRVDMGVYMGVERVPLKHDSNPYVVGRYVAQANHLFHSAQKDGDVGTALAAVSIMRFVDRSERASTKQKFRRVYDRAVQLSKEHDVPLSEPTGRRMAILPRSVYLQAQEYLQ